MSGKVRFFALALIVAFAACGGCDDEGGGNAAANGNPNSNANNGSNTGTNAGTNTGTNVDPNANPNAGTNANTGTNTGTNGGTGGLPDGAVCTSDAECDGVCNSSGVCVGGGLPDGETCTEDEQCSGFCDAGTCAGGGTFTPTTNGSGQVLCGNDPCACDNGMDDDGDGLIDGADPECTGAYDNDEGSFATGISGDNKDPKWQDCFFDGNSGAGDDHCRYHTDCLTGALPLDDPDCVVSQDCFDFCRPRTPNGCDCFGCCGVNVDGNVEFVQIGADCSVDDTSSCGSCVQTEACLNECGECELCLGKTVDDLPLSCSSGGGFDGDACTADSDCRGICGGTSTCEGFGEFGGGGDVCMTDADCFGECGQDDTCTGGGGFVGDQCTGDVDCRGVCGGNNTCEGYGGGGYDNDECMTDEDCRGVCGGNNTCEGSGSGTGSGVQCDDGLQACPSGQSDCPAPTASVSYYCLQGCCARIDS